MFSIVMPPAPRESDAPGAPVNEKSFAELNFSPSTDDGAATCAVVPAVANTRGIVPLVRSGTTSPTQLAAVAKELSAPPPSHVADTRPACVTSDQARMSASSMWATASPGSNDADVWLP